MEEETGSRYNQPYLLQTIKKNTHTRKTENLKHVAGGSVPMAHTYKPNIYSRDG